MNQEEIIKECIQKLLMLLHCEGEVIVNTKISPVHIAVSTRNDSRHLIGVRGQHLRALQHLARSILRRSLQQDISLVIDVNGYRSQHEETIRALAAQVAQKAVKSGRTVAMQPMSPADRRLIHTALAERNDIRTESLGEEPNRRVIIRPVFL